MKTVSVGLMRRPRRPPMVASEFPRPSAHPARSEGSSGAALARPTCGSCVPAFPSQGWMVHTGCRGRASAMCVHAAGARTHVPRAQPLKNHGGATDTAKRTRTCDVRVFVRSRHYSDSTFPLFRQHCIRAFSRDFYLQSELYFSIAIGGCHL